MRQRYEVRLSGEGGQGLGLAGMILAEALLQESCNVVETQNYEPQARGGASSSEVVLSDEVIGYPHVGCANALVAMSQRAYERYAGEVCVDGLILADSTHVCPPSSCTPVRVLQVPLAAVATKQTGCALVANIIALGVLSVIADLATPASLRRAIALHAPAKARKVNQKALDIGLRIGRKLARQYGVDCMQETLGE